MVWRGGLQKEDAIFFNYLDLTRLDYSSPGYCELIGDGGSEWVDTRSTHKTATG